MLIRKRRDNYSWCDDKVFNLKYCRNGCVHGRMVTAKARIYVCNKQRFASTSLQYIVVDRSNYCCWEYDNSLFPNYVYDITTILAKSFANISAWLSH